MVVYLVPSSAGRFELYAEVVSEPSREPAAGRFTRVMAAAAAGWRHVVQTARDRRRTSRVGRWTDGLVCGLADRLAEQRGLGALRGRHALVVRFPSGLGAAQAELELRRGLARVARRHRWRSALYLALFVVSGALAIVPGPNVLAYYFAVALFGHLQAWRGAMHASTGVRWVLEGDQDLADLARLVDVPRDAREADVAAIAERMKLRGLASFFNRVAAPST